MLDNKIKKKKKILDLFERLKNKLRYVLFFIFFMKKKFFEGWWIFFSTKIINDRWDILIKMITRGRLNISFYHITQLISYQSEFNYRISSSTFQEYEDDDDAWVSICHERIYSWIIFYSLKIYKKFAHKIGYQLNKIKNWNKVPLFSNNKLTLRLIKVLRDLLHPRHQYYLHNGNVAIKFSLISQILGNGYQTQMNHWKLKINLTRKLNVD